MTGKGSDTLSRVDIPKRSRVVIRSGYHIPVVRRYGDVPYRRTFVLEHLEKCARLHIPHQCGLANDVAIARCDGYQQLSVRSEGSLSIDRGIMNWIQVHLGYGKDVPFRP